MEAQLIAEILSTTGQKWSIDGKEFQPTESDVQAAIDKGMRDLAQVEGESNWYFGGICIHKYGVGYDIYVQVTSY